MSILTINDLNNQKARPLDPNAPVISAKEEVAQVLSMGEGEKAMQKIVDSIPDEIIAIGRPVILASQKKQKTEAGRESTVGEGSMLDFDATQLATVNLKGETAPLERGHTYLMLRKASDNIHVEMVEVEIPRVGSLLPKIMIFTNPADNENKVVELMKKYKLSA